MSLVFWLLWACVTVLALKDWLQQRKINSLEREVEALKICAASDRSSTLNLYKSLSSRISSLDTRVSGLEAIPLLRLFFRKKED